MKTQIFLILLLTSSMCQAQTKVIAHKSHGGSRATFAKAYQQNLFDISRTNFGLPDREVVVVLDTLIAVNDSITVMKWRESNSCHPFLSSHKDLKDSDFNYKTDTIINHEVLRRRNTATLIRNYGTAIYPIEFRHTIDSVVFIGFRK